MSARVSNRIASDAKLQLLKINASSPFRAAFSPLCRFSASYPPWI